MGAPMAPSAFRETHCKPTARRCVCQSEWSTARYLLNFVCKDTTEISCCISFSFHCYDQASQRSILGEKLFVVTWSLKGYGPLCQGKHGSSSHGVLRKWRDECWWPACFPSIHSVTLVCRVVPPTFRVGLFCSIQQGKGHRSPANTEWEPSTVQWNGISSWHWESGKKAGDVGLWM